MAKALISVLSADWHVRADDIVWKSHPDMKGDVSYGLSQLEQIALESPALIAAGDLAEVKYHYADELSLLRRFIDKLEKHNVRIYFVQGQHEWAKPTLLGSLSDWPVHVHMKRFNLGDVSAFGWDWCRAAKLSTELRELKDADLLVTHQVWKDFMGESRGVLSVSDLPSSYRLIFTGDFHRSAALSRRTGSGAQVTLLSAGPLCAQDRSEFGPKFVFKLYDDLSTEIVPLKSRRCAQVELNSEERVDEFIRRDLPELLEPQSGVPDYIAKPAVIIEYLARANIRERLEKAIKGRAHVFWIPRVLASQQSQEAEVDVQYTPIEYIKKCCAGKLEKEVVDLLSDLWESPDEISVILRAYMQRVRAGQTNANPDTGTV